MSEIDWPDKGEFKPKWMTLSNGLVLEHDGKGWRDADGHYYTIEFSDPNSEVPTADGNPLNSK